MNDEGKAILDKEHFTREGHKQIISGADWCKIKGVAKTVTINFKGADRDLRALYLGSGGIELSKRKVT